MGFAWLCPAGRGRPAPPATQDLSKNQLRSQGPGWGPDGSAGGAGAACAPGDSVVFDAAECGARVDGRIKSLSPRLDSRPTLLAEVGRET